MKFDDLISRFEKRVKTPTGWRVICPAHADKNPSLHISLGSDDVILLNCFAGCTSKSVVASLGLNLKDLFPEKLKPYTNGHATVKPTVTTSTVKPTIDKIYSYQDQTGKEVYQAIRLKPKDFRQRHSVNGNWVWNMEGVERVLYHLPEVLKSETVWVVEGEKDADNLTELGFVATCNVGGAGKWMDAYTETLAGKHIVICGDNDDAGKAHVEKVFESICGKSKTVRIVKLPIGIKDASDFIATQSSKEEAALSFETFCGMAHPFIKGLKLPLYTMSELESGYKKMVNSLAENSFDLGKWLPTLGKNLRPLICGELVFIIGNTGTGKTALLTEIAKAARPLPTILFELELPPELLFERITASKTSMRCIDIERAYKTGDTAKDVLDKGFDNLLICTESKLTLEDLETYILRSELRFGQKPKLVLIDYIQLLQGNAGTRREKNSDIAEGLKVLAKTTGTIIVVTSQVARPSKDAKTNEVRVHDGKETGSIENSCGLLLGAWRDNDDETLLHLKVLKSTKGGGGTHVKCNFDGAKMIITERTSSRIEEADVPKPRYETP